MEPYYFGRSTHLFGIFHPCLTGTIRGAVVIAAPTLSDGLRSHFTLREIASQISSSGYDVLRFDLSGCGDSFGDLASLKVEDWVEDMKDAAKELRNITGSTRLSVFSARFACHIAAAVSTNIRWDLMVMWDPILSGSDWIGRLTRNNENVIDIRSMAPHEYLGEQTSSAFTESISACHTGDISARRIVSIITDNSIKVDPSLDCRKLELDSRWDDFFLENMFNHQVVEETTKVFKE